VSGTIARAARAAASFGIQRELFHVKRSPARQMSPLRGYPIVAIIIPWADAHG